MAAATGHKCDQDKPISRFSVATMTIIITMHIYVYIDNCVHRNKSDNNNNNNNDRTARETETFCVNDNKELPERTGFVRF